MLHLAVRANSATNMLYRGQTQASSTLKPAHTSMGEQELPLEKQATCGRAHTTTLRRKRDQTIPSVILCTMIISYHRPTFQQAS